jgi:hypothetical protein
MSLIHRSHFSATQWANGKEMEGVLTFNYEEHVSTSLIFISLSMQFIFFNIANSMLLKKRCYEKTKGTFKFLHLNLLTSSFDVITLKHYI